jgi:hypothetical protein
MNVDQLIKRLQMYPPDLRVVVRGYEGGYNDVSRFENLKIVLDYYDEWYYGKHEDASTILNEETKVNVVDALQIG